MRAIEFRYDFKKETHLEDLFEMANLRPRKTGLPMVIWISTKNGIAHGPRIKVAEKHGSDLKAKDFASVSLVEPYDLMAGNLSQEDLESVRRWIELNHNVLMLYWEMELSTDEVLENLVSIN